MEYMKKVNNILIMFTGFAFLALFSCKSPSDIDTPTKKIPLNRIVPNLTNITLEEEGEKKNFIVNSTSCLIDSTSDIPFIWMDIDFEYSEPNDYSQKGICIRSFTIVMDSLPVYSNGNNELGSPDFGSWTSFIINKSNMTTDTLTSGTKENTTSFSFSFDKQRKVLIAFLYTNLYFEINQKPDSTFFRTTLKFQY